ncbi:Uncharacterized protein FWK35_00012179 [Aphis craccivora]|uniref:Uncharacterized protein n=1 Tax=Aphis craccivora TaxID=307492 RepID=A0A6G0Z8G7_APHCR|nr:Uncharacterized protein FWK35_00012179 [Aphis craccivora]
MMFGREIKAPGDWQLELAEESSDDGNNSPELSGTYQNPSVEIKDSPVEPEDTPVVGGDYLVASSPKAPSTNIPLEFPGRGNLSVGDWVYYKAHRKTGSTRGLPRNG